MTAFIDAHREVYGVEPIGKVLPIAPSTYYVHAARRADPAKVPARAERDEQLCNDIQRVWDKNRRVYGVRKVWRQLQRESIEVARCTVARLMGRLGLRGVIRGKGVKTTVSDTAAPCPRDRVNRQFRANRPNAMWVADFTYVSTWQGHLYVAPSSSTCTPAASSAGRCRTRCARPSCLMPWSRRCMHAGPLTKAA